MAMKEKIVLSRDRMIDEINASKMSELEKTELTNILIDAADGTNGLSKEDKIQNVSETVFALAKLDAQGAIDRFESAERDKNLQNSIMKLSEKVDQVVDKLSTVSDQLADNDKATQKLQSDFEQIKNFKHSRLEVFFDGLQKLRWFWAPTAIAITGMIVYKPNVLKILKDLF